MGVTDLGDMTGKKLLVGITYLGTESHPEQNVEFAGIVMSIDPLVSIDRGTGEPFTLPPAPDAFDRARPREYRLRSNGEVVVDPDFVTSWSVSPPEQSA
jgi:hypothetical protein